MSDMQHTLTSLIQSGKSLVGHELEQLVKTSLNSTDEKEIEIAMELDNKYFNTDVDDNFKPLKFVYYRIAKLVENEVETYRLRRNLFLSPRASGYFSQDGDTTDEMRDLMRTKSSIRGSDLKRVVSQALSTSSELTSKYPSNEEIEEASYLSLSRQIAQYIDEYFNRYQE